MLEGKQLILATRPFAKEIRIKSWMYMLSTLFLLVISTAGAYLAPYLPLQIACSLLASLLMVRMFVIYHDFLHHAILHKSWLANVIMTAFGIYILAPTSIWKRSHDHHHKHNSKLFSSSIGSYLILSKNKYLSLSRPQRFLYLASRHPLTILFGYLFMFIIGMCINSFISSMRRHIDSLLALLFHVALSVLVFAFLGWQVWLLGIFIPFFISCAIGAYLFYAQHNFPGVSFSENSEWSYEGAAIHSSSYMRMNPVMAWFTANIGYHHIHHLNSRIPFYRLPEVMNKMPELQKKANTSMSPRDIVACLKLKIWDPDRKQMIGLDQLA